MLIKLNPQIPAIFLFLTFQNKSIKDTKIITTFGTLTKNILVSHSTFTQQKLNILRQKVSRFRQKVSIFSFFLPAEKSKKRVKRVDTIACKTLMAK